MRLIARYYLRLLQALAAIAGGVMFLMGLMIVYDVVVRNLGFQPPPHTLTITEYALLYVTMLAAPWLVREKGHVYIELVTAAVKPRVRWAMAKLVYLLCVMVCLILFYYALDVTLVELGRGEVDIRSFDMPRWLLILCMPIGFLLMAIEFARFLVGIDTMHTGEAGIHE